MKNPKVRETDKMSVAIFSERESKIPRLCFVDSRDIIGEIYEAARRVRAGG